VYALHLAYREFGYVGSLLYHHSENFPCETFYQTSSHGGVDENESAVIWACALLPYHFHELPMRVWASSAHFRNMWSPSNSSLTVNPIVVLFRESWLHQKADRQLITPLFCMSFGTQASDIAHFIQCLHMVCCGLGIQTPAQAYRANARCSGQVRLPSCVGGVQLSSRR
jgi:hypothetical protein